MPTVSFQEMLQARKVFWTPYRWRSRLASIAVQHRALAAGAVLQWELAIGVGADGALLAVVADQVPHFSSA
jgi:hypothetical protein